ncbi:hypothetical protein DFJ77DRAFT_348311 [Powellomyces hirtus]|nr:hypothetical protein DFJ77DRAFT_348311 [Powellomyces hirtus]
MSQDFRWICERADAGLKKALVKPVLQHVLSILPHRQGLFKPIALQYTKALRLLLSRRAYREHVPRDGWEALMKVCIDGLNDDEEEESMAELGNPARHPSTNTPRGSSRKALPAEMPELARIFALLVLGCPKNLAKYAKELLVFLARFFQAHPHETSCHMPLISATNHILFEISHEALPEIVEFFSSTIPYLIPLWETRSGSAVRVQLMYIFRFYLHIYDPSDGLLSSYWDLERNCMRLYDLLQRELGSKFGIGCVQSLEDFVKSIRGDWRKQTMLAVFKDEHSDLGESAISKQYLPFAFLDWCSNVYYSLLILEQKPSRGRTASDEIANRNGDFFSDSPRAGKKAKRIDVMTDLSQILSTKAGARGEKFCVLQILTILLIKHGERLPHDHIRGIEQIVSRVLAAGDTDLAGWALLCWTALPPKFITHGDASTLRVLVLDHAWKLMSANSVASPAGFYVLERMISQETASSEEILEVATQCGKVMRTGSSRPTACALHFILTFLQWSTVHGRQIANQSILQHQVLDWLLQDRFSDAQSTVPVDLVLRAVLVMIGVFSPEPIYSVEQSLALPVDMLEKEELICEWRLIRSRDLCKLVAHEDITTLDQFAIRNSCVTSGKPSSKFRQEPLLSKLLMTCANEVLSSWNTLEFAKKTLLKADSSGLPKLMDKSLFLCLLGITFGSVTCSHLPASSALQNEIEALFVLISRIIERICQSFPALPVIDQMSFIHSIARGFAVYCANRRENITVRTANATDSAMSELDAKLSTLCLPLVDTLIQHFSTTVEQINVTQTPLTASLAASVDEFDTLNLSTRNTGQNNPLGQLDFFYEVASPSEIPDRALTIRALGILYQLIPEGDESTIFSQARVRIQEVMMDALPSSFETFTQIGKEVTEFLRHASIKRLTTAFCKLVMKNSTTLLQSYEGELNTWCSIFIMESLTAILPVLLREKDDGDFMQEAGHVFAYFMRRVQSPSAPWRVCIAFGQLLIQYLIIDPNQSLFGESVGDDGADAAMRLCLALLNHDEFLVRLSMIGAIPQLFSIFDVADHTSIFEDIRDTIKKDAKSFLSLCTETLAFGEVMLNAAHERANAALQLLMVATRDDEAFHLVETAFDVYARRLALRDGLELLDELLPTLIWAWEEDLANFPYRLFAYESIDAFVSGHLDLNLPKLLSAGDIVAAEKLYLAIGAEGTSSSKYHGQCGASAE